MNDDQYKVLTEKFAQILSVVDRIDKDLVNDREDIQHFSLRLGSLENQQAEIWKILNNLPERTKQEVQLAVKPIVTETSDLKDVIAEKKFIAIDIAKAKKSFWKWLFRR